MSITEAHVRDLVAAPPDYETVEIVRDVDDPMAAARLIAAFANGAGGTLVVGYSDTEKLRADRYRLRGVEPAAALRGIQVALGVVVPNLS